MATRWTDARTPPPESQPAMCDVCSSRTPVGANSGHLQQAKLSGKLLAALALCTPQVQLAVRTLVSLGEGDGDLCSILASSDIRALLQVAGGYVQEYCMFDAKALHQLTGLPDSKTYKPAGDLLAAAQQVQQTADASYDALSVGISLLHKVSQIMHGTDDAKNSRAGGVNTVAVCSQGCTFDPSLPLSADEAFDRLARVPTRARMQLRNYLGGDSPNLNWRIKGVPLLTCLHALYHTPLALDAAVTQLLRCGSHNARHVQLSQPGIERLRQYAAHYIENLGIYPDPASAEIVITSS